MSAESPEAPESLDLDNLDEYSEEEIEAYNERKEQDLRERGAEHQRELDEEQQAALEALRDPEEDDTAQVELGQRTLTVNTYMDEEIERTFERLTENREDPDIQRQLLPEVMAWMIEAPEEYTDPLIWREYAREYGRDELALALMRVVEPKADRAESDEVVQRFRGE